MMGAFAITLSALLLSRDTWNINKIVNSFSPFFVNLFLIAHFYWKGLEFKLAIDLQIIELDTLSKYSSVSWSLVSEQSFWVMDSYYTKSLCFGNILVNIEEQNYPSS